MTVTEPYPVRLRPAVAADNARLCELFAGVRMQADLSLGVERDPDFFRLYDIQEGRRSVWVGEVAGRVEAVVAGVARPAWLGDEQVSLGYLGDARVSTEHQGKGLMRYASPLFLDKVFTELGCEVALAAMLGGNRAALGAAQTPAMLASGYDYRPVYDLDIVSVQFTWRRKPRPTPYVVATAQPGDLAELVAFLAADQRTRPFGHVVDAAWLRQRLEQWPDFALDNFYLARDAGGGVRGVLAWWDPQQVKRYRVHGYFRLMRLGKWLYDAAAWLGRFQPLPPAGAVLRSFYVTHLAVPGREPAVLAALIDRLYADLHARGYGFFTMALPGQDALAAALRRYQKTHLAVQVYFGHRHGSRFSGWQPVAASPGFEIALA